MHLVSTPAVDKSKSRILCLTVAILPMFLSACAVERPFRFHANSITRISYDPNNCTQMPDGKFKCKDVIFHGRRRRTRAEVS